MPFPSGPLTGAPLNFPGPECCAPACIFSDLGGMTVLLAGPGPAVAFGSPDCWQEPMTVQTFLIPTLAPPPVDPVLVINSAIVVGDTVVFDVASVPDNDGGLWVVVLKNACGCCYIPGFVQIAVV